MDIVEFMTKLQVPTLQDPDYQHSAIGKVFSALKIPWNMFGEPSHGYKDLDFLEYAFHADQVVNDKVTL